MLQEGTGVRHSQANGNQDRHGQGPPDNHRLEGETDETVKQLLFIWEGRG